MKNITREIKFRAWDKETKEMFKVGAMTYDDEIFGIVADDEEWKHHINTELMQYTGLLDKNGKEIYEGDIVQSGNGRIWEIKFGEFRYEANHYEVIGWYAIDDGCNYPLLDSGWEIIGNIYENPNLLK